MLAGSLLMLSSVSAYASGTTATLKVAVLGQAAPGGGTFDGGGPYDAFDEPRTNPAGNVLFEAQVKTGATTFNEGMYFWNGTLHKVVRQGDTLPGIGKLSGSFDAPLLNEVNTIALVNYGATSGTSTFDVVIHKSVGGTWTLAAKTGQAAPCPGGPFTFVTFDDAAQNDRNDLAFLAQYKDSANTFHAGVFVKYSLKPVTAIACDGDQLGTNEGTLSANGTGVLDGPAINDQGDVAFQPQNVVGGSARNGSDGVYLKPKGMAIRPLVKEADPGPPTIGGTIDGISLTAVSLNTQAIGLKLSTKNGTVETSVIATKGIAAGGALTACASEGETAPGTGGGVFASFEAPTLSDNGNLGFSAEVGTTDSIFACRNSVITPFVLQGDPRPGGGTYTTLEESSIGGDEATTDYEIAFLQRDSSDNATGVFVG
jgi:hypothetical protein